MDYVIVHTIGAAKGDVLYVYSVSRAIEALDFVYYV